jgi:hypothetical protein
VLGYVGGFGGLSSVGRQGAFRYVFMDTAMEMGIEAARAAIRGTSAAPITELGGTEALHEARVMTA